VCDIPPVCGLKIVENASNESYLKPLDVDGVNTPCKFLAWIKIYMY